MEHNKSFKYNKSIISHLYEPVLRRTCVRRELTYKWFASMSHCLHLISTALFSSLALFVVAALFVFGGFNFDLVSSLTYAFLAFNLSLRRDVKQLISLSLCKTRLREVAS